MKKIVVVGGGFAGLYFAKRFNSNDAEVVLIDRRNHHLFQPLLYQVATGGLSAGDIAYPLRSVLAKQKNVRVVQDEVIDIHSGTNSVITKKGIYEYDALILATGAENFYFGNEDWSKVAPGLKSVEDALEMRAKILTALESAELESDSEKKLAKMTFVVIGGGPTGVELSGAIAELTKKTLRGTFRNIDSTQAKIVMIEAAGKILSVYSDKLSAKAVRKLEKMDVDVRTNTKVVQMNPDSVVVESNGKTETIYSDTILWGAGVRAGKITTTISKEFNAETDRGARLIVDEFLRIPNQKNVFVVGDIAHFKTSDGNILPGTAPVAMQQGNYLAKNLMKIIADKKVKPFRYWDKGSLAVIGRNQAIAQIAGLQLSGFSAWIIWIFVHIGYLIGFDNRVLVLFQWAWNYFTRKRGALLITNQDKSEKQGERSDSNKDETPEWILN